MKKSILFLAIIITNYVAAQNKSTELFELIKSFAPKSADVSGNWQNTDASVKWKTAQPVLQRNNYVHSGKSSIIINGKKVTCVNGATGDESPCDWNVSLTGNKAGYNKWEIFADDFQISDQKKATSMLFPGAGNQIKVLNKYDESMMDWFYVYEVNTVGRKTFYMRVEFFTGTATGGQAANVGHDSFSISCFLNKADAMK